MWDGTDALAFIVQEMMEAECLSIDTQEGQTVADAALSEFVECNGMLESYDAYYVYKYLAYYEIGFAS